MRFSDTLITIASLSAAAQAKEVLPLDDGCENEPESCYDDDLWFNEVSMEFEENEPLQDVIEDSEDDEENVAAGEECEPNNVECNDGWSFPT